MDDSLRGTPGRVTSTVFMTFCVSYARVTSPVSRSGYDRLNAAVGLYWVLRARRVIAG